MSNEKKDSDELVVDPDKEKVLEAMKLKAKEIHTYLRLNQKEYTLEDYLAFSFITFMEASALIPQFMPPTRYMLGLWIDGQLQMKEMKELSKYGILSLQKE